MRHMLGGNILTIISFHNRRPLQESMQEMMKLNELKRHSFQKSHTEDSNDLV